MKLVILFFVVSILSGTVFGATAASITEDDFRNSAGDLVGTLISHGYQRLGNFDLNQFIQELKTVHYKLVPQAQNAQGRHFLKYDVPTKTVFAPSIELGLDPNEASQILLHESLGALGYVDDNYQMSNMIQLLTIEVVMPIALSPESLLSSPNFQDPFLKTRRTTNPSFFENKFLVAGGSNGTGGGGDPIAAIQKFYALYMIAKLLGERGLVNNDAVAWISNHVGVETYTHLPDKSEVVACPIHSGSQGAQLLADIDATLIVRDEDAIAKIYYPESCSEDFQMKNNIPLVLLSSRISAKMIHIYEESKK